MSTTYNKLSRFVVAGLVAAAFGLAAGYPNWLYALRGISYYGGSVPSYAASRLGTLGGGTSFAMAINERGDVAGSSTLKGDATSHAFLRTSGRMYDLGTLGGEWSEATAVNARRDVAGTAATASGDMHAFLYTNGFMLDIGRDIGGLDSRALGMNARGDVVGVTHLAGTGETRPFVYSSGRVEILGTLGGTFAYAFAINDAGVVTGTSETSTGESHAFLWRHGLMVDLGTPYPQGVSVGFDVNALLQVTGYMSPAGPSQTRAFIYSMGTMYDLGTLPGATTSVGEAINDRGDVVGDTEAGAFLYSGGAMYQLDSLIVNGAPGLRLWNAQGINAHGQIIAYGCASGACEAYLVEPRVVPPTRGR